MVVKLHEAKEELNNKIESVVETMYDKMRITHTNQLNELEEKIANLTKEVSLANEKIKALESQ